MTGIDVLGVAVSSCSRLDLTASHRLTDSPERYDAHGLTMPTCVEKNVAVVVALDGASLFLISFFC